MSQPLGLKATLPFLYVIGNQKDHFLLSWGLADAPEMLTLWHKSWDVWFPMSSIASGCKGLVRDESGNARSAFGGGSREWVHVCSQILTSAEEAWGWICTDGWLVEELTQSIFRASLPYGTTPERHHSPCSLTAAPSSCVMQKP